MKIEAMCTDLNVIHMYQNCFEIRATRLAQILKRTRNNIIAMHADRTVKKPLDSNLSSMGRFILLMKG